MPMISTTRPVYKILRYLGFAPFTNYSSPNKTELLYTASVYVLHLFSSLMYTGNKLFHELECLHDTDIVDSIHYFSSLFYPIFDTACYFIVLFKNSKMRSVLKEILNCDHTLSTIDCHPPIKAEYRFQVVTITTNCCIFTFSLFWILNADHNIGLSVFYQLHMLLVLCLFSEFCTLGYVLLQRFVIINVELETLGKCVDSIYRNKLVSLKKFETKLLILCKLHVKLQSVLNTLESYYSFQLVLVVVMNIWKITLVILTFLTEKYRTERTCSYLLLGDRRNLVTLTVFYWLYIASEISNSLTNEANRSAKMVHLIQRRFLPPSIIEKIETFSLGILNKPIQFADCGFFTVNRTLFTKMSVTIITLLVILLQTSDVQHHSTGHVANYTATTTALAMYNSTEAATAYTNVTSFYDSYNYSAVLDEDDYYNYTEH